MSHRSVVYVAGPYSHPDPVENTRRAIDAGAALWATGFVAPLIPHLSLLAHLVHPMPVDDWYALDLDLLAKCDAMLRIPGDSAGADAEVLHAKRAGIPVFASVDLVEHWAKGQSWPL